MSRSVCYDVSLGVLRRKCHCKSSRMFNHSLHHHLLLWWWWFFILFSWFMTVNGRYLAFAKMAKWSDFSLHFLTELGCEMLADNGFVAYITQHTKNPSIWMEYLKHQKIAFYRHSVWKWIKKSKYFFKMKIRLFGDFQSLCFNLFRYCPIHNLNLRNSIPSKILKCNYKKVEFLMLVKKWDFDLNLTIIDYQILAVAWPIFFSS